MAPKAVRPRPFVGQAGSEFQLVTTSRLVAKFRKSVLDLAARKSRIGTLIAHWTSQTRGAYAESSGDVC